MIATVGGESGLVLAAQDDSSLGSNAAEGFAGGVDTYHLRSGISAWLSGVVLIIGTSIEIVNVIRKKRYLTPRRQDAFPPSYSQLILAHQIFATMSSGKFKV